MTLLPSSSVFRIAVVAALAAILSLVPQSFGQSTPASAVGSRAEDEDDIVQLSPFTVSADEDSGYRAGNTLSGTRIKTSLRDIGASIQVITPEFLDHAGGKEDELYQGHSRGQHRALEVDRNCQWAYPGVLFHQGTALLHYFRSSTVDPRAGRELVLARIPVSWFYGDNV